MRNAIQKHTKYANIQGLKAIAFLTVFLEHTGLPYTGCLGMWGVSVFIILSGFLMAYLQPQYQGKATIKECSLFVYRKIKKLYPLHIIMLLMVAILEFGAMSKKQLLVDIIIQAFCVWIWIPNNNFWGTLNDPTWYLCVYVFCAFTFPILYRKIKVTHSHKLKQVAVLLYFSQWLVTGIASIIGDQYFSGFMVWLIYFHPISRLSDFYIGSIWGELLNRRLNSKEKDTQLIGTKFEIVIIVLIIFEEIVPYCLKNTVFLHNSTYVTLKTPINIGLICLLFLSKGWFSKLLSRKIFVQVGDISPYAFLIHRPVLKYFGAFFPQLGSYWRSILSLLCTIIAAIIWQGIIKCMNTLKRE